ncbi:aldo/keto reductase [Agrococcus carbonis]|uniref:Aldo/keto reductase n=1 Tax=Agrococcus carbonis TaxID=684552 RepID=A0A1H1RK80_9MICO|nr:aldo/keto reductase [Agrococcus carbonis]SDS36100.1 Aldo/keto reductase [Agrococcus carbonis]
MPSTLPLNDGSAIPALGFGLYKVPADETERVVADGIAAGYRLIDGAEFYGNEREMGDGVRRAVDAGVPREDLTVTSKFWGDPVQSADALRASFEQSAAALGTGIDVYMIHWPRPARDRFVEVWRAMLELQQAGRVRTLGVSNFTEQHLQRLIDETGVTPAINQVESHPWLPQHELRAFHAEHGIVTQAWSPLGRARVLSDPTIQAIARAHGVSPAQAIIRWHLQLGGALIPKSTHPHRLRENLDVDGFALSDDEMAQIAALETGERTGTHPDERQ